MSAGRFLVGLSLSVAWGCGGGAAAGPGPESGRPEPAGEKSDDTPADAAQAEKQPETEAAPPEGSGSAEPAADAPLEPKEIEAALQALFGDSQLLDNLHLSLPGRSPLKLSGAKLPPKLAVIVASHEVKVVPEPKSKKEPVMVFTKVEREGGQIKLHYRFDVEGLEGRATLTRKEGRWELTANRVIEK